MVHANMTFKMRSISRTSKQDKVNVAVEQNMDIQDDKYKQDRLIAELKRARHAPKNDYYISIEVQLQELVNKEEHRSQQKYCLLLGTCKKY
jgi:hypothetical protein